MQLAAEAFLKGDSEVALKIYNQIIEGKCEQWKDALLNRASLHLSTGQYAFSLRDSYRYLSLQGCNVQGYVVFASSLIKTRALIDGEQKELLKKGKEKYPYHKKYLDLVKTIEELQVSENDETYLQQVFTKLLRVPSIRVYMAEESFLTKLEKMIRNPSLASVLIKMDNRLSEAQDVILSADQGP